MATKKNPTKKRPNALEFCRAVLRDKPKSTYAEIKEAADKAKIKLYPISFGRAQALEGIVKSKPYGSKKKAAGKEAKRGPGRPKGSKNKAKRGPGRPRRASANGADLKNLLTTVRGIERERDAALRTLDKIRQLLA